MTTLPEPSHTPEMRVSHADRERVAAVLQQAVADGRIEIDELDDRLRATYAAKTYGELAKLTSDLPATVQTSADPATSDPVTADPAVGLAQPGSRWAVAVFGGFTRRGPWVVPRRFRALAFCGGGKLDLRDARYAHNDTRIRIIALMGGVEVIVPPEAHVNVDGLAIMGGWDQPGEGADNPDGPRISIGGFTLMGGVSVKRQRTRRRTD